MTLSDILTPETLIAILGLFAAVVQWRKSISLQRMQIETEAARQAAETAKKKAEAEIEQIKADTEIRVQQAKDNTADQTFMREQLKTQLEVNKGLQERNQEFFNILKEKESRDESNYRHLANTQRDNTQMLLTEIQSHNKHVNTVIEAQNLAAAESRKLTQERIDLLGEQFRNIVVEMAEILKAAAAETGLVMARQVAIQRLDNDLFLFPEAEDPRWKTVFLKPTKPEVWLFKQPYLYDNARLQKPCAQIKPEGQRAQIITGQLQDWLIVMKENGEKCWGYVPAHAVTIHLAAPELVH